MGTLAGVTGWRKSARSGTNGGHCVEAAPTTRTVAVRDSKHPDGPQFAVSRSAWSRFVRSLR